MLGAALELFLAHDFTAVTLAAVAERAGLSVQTVIRVFGSKEGLVAAAVEQVDGQVAALRHDARPGDVGSIVAAVDRHYEVAADLALRLDAGAAQSPALAALRERAAAGHRQWCEHLAGPWLAGLSGAARRRRVAQVVAVTDVHTWVALRRDAGLSPAQTRLALRELLAPLDTAPLDTTPLDPTQES